MNDIEKCQHCKGKRYFIGTGMIRINCPTCKAIGYLSNGDPQSSTDKTPDDRPSLAKFEPIKTAARRGRPPKVTINAQS